MIVNFACWVAIIALCAAFVLSLAKKWGILEWLQVHAPCDFLYNLFMCKFCCSFWVSMAISLTLSVVTGNWLLMAAPVCTTIVTRELW